MIQNPFLEIPQVESDASLSWEAGFLYGFQGPEQSTMTQADAQTPDAEAFNRGVIDGQTAAINGLDLRESCIDLNVEPPSFAHFAAEFSIEGTLAVASYLGKHFMAYGYEGIIAVINLSIAVETFSDDPEVALTARINRVQEQLNELGFTNSMELFFGGGVDLSATGCELKVTPIFRRQEDATNAARSFGRDKWLIVAWRSDQCNGLRTVDSAGF